MIKGHGDDIYRYTTPIKANFSSNVYCGFNLAPLKEHLATKLGSIATYPEPEPYKLEEAIKKLIFSTDIASKEVHKDVCVTNGATEAIYLIAQYLSGKTSIILVPTFSEYQDSCSIFNHRILYAYSLEQVEMLLEENREAAVWVCNPNNPTGEVRDKKRLLSLFLKFKEATFILDQSYQFFTKLETILPNEVGDFNNLFLLNSMTKKYSIPGIRLGYVVAQKELLDKIRAFRMPWTVNSLAIEAGLYLAQRGLPPAGDLDELLSNCALLQRGIMDIRMAGEPLFTVVPTNTHYMLVKINREINYKEMQIKSQRAADLKEYLAGKYGILIRDCANFVGLEDNCFRVATQTLMENNMLLNGLGSIAL